MKFVNKEKLNDLGETIAIIITLIGAVAIIIAAFWPISAAYLICGAMGVIGWIIKKIFYFILELIPWTKSKSVGDKWRRS